MKLLALDSTLKILELCIKELAFLHYKFQNNNKDTRTIITKYSVKILKLCWKQHHHSDDSGTAENTLKPRQGDDHIAEHSRITAKIVEP